MDGLVFVLEVVHFVRFVAEGSGAGFVLELTLYVFAHIDVNFAAPSVTYLCRRRALSYGWRFL
jgi:hypothetical protein